MSRASAHAARLPWPDRPPRARRVAACAAVLAAGLAGGCGSGPAGPGPRPEQLPRAVTAGTAPSAGAGAPARPAVAVPRPDYADPASVAAAFFTAWASVDAGDDRPAAFVARIAPLVTPALARQLAAGQPGPADWQLMRDDDVISLVHVQAVTHPSGAPPPSRAQEYLRIYAVRVTTTAGRRATISDGITVRLTRLRRRWLVAQLLFW